MNQSSVNQPQPGHGTADPAPERRSTTLRQRRLRDLIARLAAGDIDIPGTAGRFCCANQAGAA